jgi:D-3-phosphoglycerate dehydrogenase / 2-oxoglutarate reductase
VLSDGVARITEIRDIKIDAAFAPNMIYVRNADKPGFIGAFGSLLGEGGVNIATFNLGRDRAGGDAICFVAVDSHVSDELLAKVEAIPQVKRARRLEF